MITEKKKRTFGLFSVLSQKIWCEQLFHFKKALIHKFSYFNNLLTVCSVKDKGITEDSSTHFLGLYYVGLSFSSIKEKWQGAGLGHF